MRFAWENWSSRGTSDLGPSGPGQLVDTAGPRTHAPLSRDSWLIPRVLGHGPESPGELIEPVSPQTRA